MHYRLMALLAMLLFSSSEAVRAATPQFQFKVSGIGIPGAALSYMILADVNQDGKLDIVATDVFSGKIFVFRGRGDGTFLAPLITTLNAIPFPIAIADVTGDGIPDLVVAGVAEVGGTYGGQLFVLPGNGDGTFQAPSATVNLAEFPLALAIGDFQHKGTVDIAVEESAQLVAALNSGDLTNLLTDLATLSGAEIEIENNDGHGHVTLGNTIPISGGGGLVLLTADWNHDGYADLALNQVGAGNVQVFLGEGNSTFKAPEVYEGIHGGSTNGVQLRTADVNGDGQLDLVMTSGQNNEVLVFAGKGDGTFSSPTETPYHDTGGLAIADFNGDGFPDIAIGTVAGFNAVLGGNLPTPNGDSIVIIPGASGGPSLNAPTVVASATVPIILETGDFNGDGLPDIAAVDVFSASVTVLIDQTAVSRISILSSAWDSAAVAPESLAAAYGVNLTVGSLTDETLPLPTILNGVQLQVTDSAGVMRSAPLLYAGPTQINFEVPAGTAGGIAQLSLEGAPGGTVSGTVTVSAVAPGLFTANGTGTGVPAATAVRSEKNTSAVTKVPIFTCTTSGGCVPAPIELDANSTVYLTLYGTGIRGAGSTSNVSCTIGGVPATILFAGSQGQFTGLDQVNIQVPASLAGKGSVNLLLTASGVAANPVTLMFQ